MAFSYSGITNYGKTTLPSVESWGTNMSILRDPVKSITTRRIDKVGDTNAILDSIDDSGDRNCEAILTYARGVNPMVSVSYSNNGNNGGQGVRQNQTQAYSSRTIMKDGEFRPPVFTQEELLPLSRQPRIWTTASTQPGFADFSKKMRTCGTAQETKEVKNNLLNTAVRPTAVYKVEKPIEEPFEVKYVIQPTLRTSGTSGIRTMDRTNQHVLEPTKEVNRNMVYAKAHSNFGSSQNYVNNSVKNTDPYTQDTNYHSVFSNVGSGLNVTNIEEVLDLSDVKTQDNININYNTSMSGTDQSSYIHDDIELSRKIPEYKADTSMSGTDQSSYIHGDIEMSRKLPEYKANTNIRQNIHKTIDHTNSIELERNIPLTNISVNPGNVSRGNSDNSSREYHLASKIQPGGYSVPTQVPMIERMQNVRSSQDSDKSKMSKAVMLQFQGRYEH